MRNSSFDFACSKKCNASLHRSWTEENILQPRLLQTSSQPTLRNSRRIGHLHSSSLWEDRVRDRGTRPKSAAKFRLWCCESGRRECVAEMILLLSRNKGAHSLKPQLQIPWGASIAISPVVVGVGATIAVGAAIILCPECVLAGAAAAGF